MKKILIPAIVAGLFLLTGCGGTNTATPEPQAPQKVETPAPAARTWNTSDINALTNGNMQYAAELVRERTGDLASSAIEAVPADVMRRPWDYYGKVVSFSGTVAVVQDSPPGDNLSKGLGGSACEIVITADDVIIDGLLAGNSSGVYTGDWVTFYGYPCGTMEVDNKIGGKFKHLLVIGTR